MAAPSASPIQNPRNSFPAWRLPNGTINATDTELDGASSSCELWEWGCAGLVVAAVSAEIIIAWLHPPYDSPFNEWGSTLADAVIAIGIVGEVVFSRLDARIQTELRRRSNEKLASATKSAAEANVRAAEAELKAETLRSELAWRRITAQEAEKISEVLGRADLPKFGLRIFHVANDPEALTLSQDIAEVFRRNGWPVLFVATTQAIPPGMMIPLYAAPDLDACGITRMAFQNAGIQFMGGYPEQGAGMMAASGDNIPGPAAAIYVGSRLPPKLNPPAATETTAANP